MSRLSTRVIVQTPSGHRRSVPVMIDSGSNFTIINNVTARALGLRPTRNREQLQLGGGIIDAYRTRLDVHVPETDCFVEALDVLVIEHPEEDFPFCILGVNFLQLAGGALDFGRNRHSVKCNTSQRGEHSDEVRMARPVRSNPRRR